MGVQGGLLAGKIRPCGYTMSCYVMLCYVILYYAMLSYYTDKNHGGMGVGAHDDVVRLAPLLPVPSRLFTKYHVT